MSLKPDSLSAVPAHTVLVARAAFPKGNPYLTLRDSFGSIFTDEDFADLFPRRGQPAYAPWRLALVTILQFRENLPDRQAVEAVRARIDWKYLLGLDLTDAGFDNSVLSEFRSRLLEGGAESRLLDKLLVHLQETGLLKERGRQRSDSTHVLSAVRDLNRLEHVAETLRAALNAAAQIAPDWLQSIAPLEWFERYSRRVEDSRLAKGKAKRDAYFMQVGADGFLLLDACEKAPAAVSSLKEIAYLAHVWSWHFVREKPPEEPNSDVLTIRAKEVDEKGPAGQRPTSPYDYDARYGNKGGDPWIGYRTHITETCDDASPRFITHVIAKAASFHDSHCAPMIHEALVKKKLRPGVHLVDTGYITAKAMLDSQQRFGVNLIGATMYNTSWQKRKRGAFGTDQFAIDWEKKQIRCPEGKLSEAWGEYETEKMGKYVRARFSAKECQACSAKANCFNSKTRGRQLTLRRHEAYQMLEQMRQETKSEKGKENYKRRAGIEGTISQAVRGFGLRKTRYRSMAKTRLQTIATAAAMNIDRFFAWQQGTPLAKTRTSHFAALAILN